MQQPLIAATPFEWQDPRTIPPRRWLFGHHAVRAYVSITGAPGGLGKTALLTTEALALASGRDLLRDHLRGAATVWYAGLEDPLEEYKRRFIAAMLHHAIAPADIANRLYVDSGRDQEFIIAHDGRNGVAIAEPVVESIISEIRRRSIDYLVIDPFVASHRVEESGNTKIEIVAREWVRIAQRTGIAIELVHHLRKGGASGGEPSVDELRGASTLVTAARSVRMLVGMTETQADEAGVDDRSRFFTVQKVKRNLAPKDRGATWRQLTSVSLMNGGGGDNADEIGVVERWQWPDALRDVTGSDLRRVQEAVAAGMWRESSQAGQWVGRAVADVLGLNVADKADKKRITTLVGSWIKADALRVVEHDDDKRMKRKFVEVGALAA